MFLNNTALNGVVFFLAGDKKTELSRAKLNIATSQVESRTTWRFRQLSGK